MDAVVLDHVDKAYTTYGTDIVLTGETRPFPLDETTFGLSNRDLTFVVMEKALK